MPYCLNSQFYVHTLIHYEAKQTACVLGGKFFQNSEMTSWRVSQTRLRHWTTIAWL